MQTNADITIYNKYLDPLTMSSKYQRTVIRGVFWRSLEASIRVQTGHNTDDNAYIVIPLQVEREASYVTPKVFQDLEDRTGVFTLAPEDKIVKGEILLEITGRISDLDKAYEAYEITGVDTRNYGSRHLQHWAVTAK